MKLIKEIDTIDKRAKEETGNYTLRGERKKMALFEEIKVFKWDIIAIFNEYNVGVFNLNEESLKNRIETLKRTNRDTSEEEKALKALQEAII